MRLFLQVPTEEFDGWARAAGFDESSKFLSALRMLQTKGFLRLERSPAVQIRVPAAARKLQPPENEDERAAELEAKREGALSKLSKVRPLPRSKSANPTRLRTAAPTRAPTPKTCNRGQRRCGAARRGPRTPGFIRCPQT